MRRAAAGLLALFWGVVFYGVIDLLAFLQGADYHDALMLSTGWGVLFVFLVAAPLAALCLAPTAAGAAATVQVGLVALALATAAVLSGYPRVLLAAVGVLATAAVAAILAAHPPAAWFSSWHWSSGSLAVIAVAAGPLCAYAWTSARNTGAVTIHSESVGLDHWPVQAALPVAALMIGAFAAGHPRGWRVPAWSVAAAGTWFAIVCLVEPRLVGSVSRAWSATLLGWSAVFVAVTRLSERSGPRAASGSAGRGSNRRGARSGDRRS